MQTTPSDMTPAAAARLLLWFAEMGADEVLSAAPINRFETRFETLASEAKPAIEVKSFTPLPPQSDAAIGVSAEDAAQSAASCSSLPELTAAFRAFDINGLTKSAVQFCFLHQDTNARILVLSDRPRTEEEQEGGVFAGKQAVLLKAMLQAIGLCFPGEGPGKNDAEVVSLANLVPRRPPGNRNPNDIEINMCVPFLRRALDFLQPELILALGALPAKYLASANDSVAQQRGKWHAVSAANRHIPLLSTFHPFELLNYPERKKLAWRDLQMFRERMDNR